MSRKKLVIPDHGDVVCCSCNCSELHSCTRPVAGSEIEICQWTWVDRKAQVGLCSFCAGRLTSPSFPVSGEIRDLARAFRRLLSEAAVLDGQVRMAELEAEKTEKAIDSGRIR